MIDSTKNNDIDSRVRNTNLELLRICAMLLIIAHHFVVNSGITEYYDFESISPNMIYLQFLGMWGKTAINIFVLISGYFMCTSNLTVKRFGKIYLEAKFYKIVIFIILLICGYETLDFINVYKVLFGYWYGIGNSFTSSFFAFYLFIPFYNILIRNMNKKQHLSLMGLSLFTNTIVGTFFFNKNVFSEPIWYMVLFFVAAYIRLYPARWMNDRKILITVLVICVGLAYASVLLVIFFGVHFGITNAYYMISDSNKFLAFMIGLFTFLFFNNLKVKYSRSINSLAVTTFGVFCIHANSAAMRSVLWKDLLSVPEFYSVPLFGLITYSIMCVLGVFAICSLIDMLRIIFFERPLINWLARYKWWNAKLFHGEM